MSLNIKNSEVEHLAAALAKELGVTKTEAIRQALAEKAQIYGIFEPKKKDHSAFNAFLEEMWAKNPKIRETRFTKEDDDALFE